MLGAVLFIEDGYERLAAAILTPLSTGPERPPLFSRF